MGWSIGSLLNHYLLKRLTHGLPQRPHRGVVHLPQPPSVERTSSPDRKANTTAAVAAPGSGYVAPKESANRHPDEYRNSRRHHDIVVSVARQGTVDLMVFQLMEDHRVRNNDDFIFDQPKSPEGAVQLIGADRLSLDLSLVPAHIHTLSIAALDESVSGTLAAVPGLGVTVEQPPGLVVQAPASGLSSERAAILVEIYRRNGTWEGAKRLAGVEYRGSLLSRRITAST